MKMALTVFTVGSTFIQGWAAMFFSALLAQNVEGITGLSFWQGVLIVVAGRIAINKPKVDMVALRRADMERRMREYEARHPGIKARPEDFRR